MASSAQIDPISPETLPADFSEWDGNSESSSPPPPPAAVVPISSGKNFELPAATVQSLRPASTATAPVNVLPPINRLRNTAPMVATAAHTDTESLFQPRRSTGVALPSLRLTLEDKVEPKSKSKNRMMVAVVTVCSILLLFILIQVIDPNLLSRISQKETVASQPLSSEEAQPAAIPYSQSTTPDADPTVRTSATPKPSAANTQPATTTSKTAPTEEAPLVASDMMNNQLSTPIRISREMKAPPAQEAPPPAGVAGIDGLAGNGANAIGSVFKGQGGPKVKVGKVNISAGVAVGLLIQKTAPIYPPIAKSARVSGTVMLRATISKTGSITSPRVISGPPMLQQSALDAVRSWRYRPYRLNSEPVEVETTVSVVFTLDR